MENKRIKSKTDISKTIEENKHYITITAIYILGLLVGTIVYKNLDTASINELLEKTAAVTNDSFIAVLTQKLITYLSIYLFTIVFGLSVIGYPFINIIPFLCGFEAAVKLSYYYTSYNVKGVGYSLLLNAPEISLYIVVIIFAVKKAGELSRKIFRSSFLQELEQTNPMSYYSKIFIIYTAAVLGVALINSSMEYLLKTVVTL